MFQFLKDFFGFGSKPYKINLNPEPGEDFPPLQYTSTYVEPLPLIIENDDEEVEVKENI